MPLISLFAFWGRDSKASYDYLFNLAFAYFVCYTGFMLFPVASPYYQKELYTIPFDGYVFTWFGLRIWQPLADVLGRTLRRIKPADMQSPREAINWPLRFAGLALAVWEFPGL